MIPIHLILKNATGIRAGLGRDEVEIDLGNIPHDALIVALRGDNGSGKSTILNLGLHPWREPPHLVGTLYDQFGDGDGLRELVWTHAGVTYRSRIEIKKGRKTRTMKAYLHRRQDDQWIPVSLDDRTESDGKASTYDQCLEALLGPPDLYFLSAFRSQGSPTLAEHDDPKSLMRDLLNLESTQKLSEQAHDVARFLKPRYISAKSDLDQLTMTLQELGEWTQHACDLDADAARLQSEHGTRQEQASVARARYERQLAEAPDTQAILGRKNALNAKLAKVDEDERTAIDTLRADIATTKRQTLEAIDTGKKRIAAANNAVMSHRARIRTQESLLGEAEKIAAAESQVAVLEQRVKEATQAYTNAKAQSARTEKLQREKDSLAVKRAGLVRDGKHLAGNEQKLTARAGFVDLVPCGGVAPYDQCPALAEARLAESELANVREQLGVMRAQVGQINDAVAAFSQQIQDGFVDLDSAERSRNNALTLYTEAQTTANRRDVLDNAKAFIAASEANIHAAEQDIVDATDWVTQAESQGAAKVLDLELRIIAATDKAETDRCALRAEIAELPPVEHNEALDRARIDRETADQAVQVVLGRLTETQAQSAELRARIKAREDALANRDTIRATAAMLEDEVAYWDLLAAALKGVVDLSIEDAGPAIASIANDLLRDAYGPRFTVRIVSQRALKSGALRETFDISVLDAETSMESSLLSKSGGETVWINQALVQAVAIHHRESAGVDYECAFGDEVEDGLTQERKRQFYRMDRAALHRGGYQRKFLVSHDPQAWELADHVIDMEELR